MFDRFSRSARSVIFRARDNAKSDGRGFIEPDHILLALIDLYPQLFDGFFNSSSDLQSFRREIAHLTRRLDTANGATKLRLNEESRRVMGTATEEARTCWELWEAPRRKDGGMLPEDETYWEARLGQSIRIARLPKWLVRWRLQRKWEVDERHLFLGLLKEDKYPGITALLLRGVTLESARQRLCATQS